MISRPKHSAMPVWSPDGSKLAFYSSRSGTYQVWTMDADGSHQKMVSDGQHESFFPSWSPDGKQLAFQALTDRNDYDVFVVNADGSHLENLTPDDRLDQSWPRWSPDGNRIVFQSQFQDGQELLPKDLWSVNPAGTRRDNLTKTDEGEEFQAAWSPDGKQLAFVSTRHTEPTDLYRRYDLFVVDADGNHPRRLTYENYVGAFNPAWSPDGKTIAYTLGSVDCDIATIKTDGSDRKVVARQPGDDMWPAWSADGKTLAFSNTRDNVTWQMYTVPAEGGAPRPLLSKAEDERLPVYSPDGKRVAFQAVRDGVEQVFTCAPDGSDVRQLT